MCEGACRALSGTCSKLLQLNGVGLPGYWRWLRGPRCDLLWGSSSNKGALIGFCCGTLTCK